MARREILVMSRADQHHAWKTGAT